MQLGRLIVSMPPERAEELKSYLEDQDVAMKERRNKARITKE